MSKKDIPEEKTSKEEMKQSSKKQNKKQQIEELKQQLEDSKNDYLRLLADFENFRRRHEQEKQEIRDKSVTDFVEDILPIIDNFELSLKMTDNKEMFVKGVEMIHKNLLETLQEHKFEHFEPEIGEEFNPAFHDPQTVEHEEAESGKVLGIVKKGVKKGDKIVRPAKVEVKKS